MGYQVRVVLGVALGCCLSLRAVAQCSDEWTVLPTETPNQLSGVAFGDGIYVAVGAAGEILTSPDGVSWSDAGTPPLGFTYLDVVFAGGQFVACGRDGRIDVLSGPNVGAVSFGNGTSWSAVAFGNGVWTAVGGTFDINQGWFDVVARSTDGGNTWTVPFVAPAAGPLSVPLGVAYGNGIFVLANGDGTVRTSLDGASWSSKTSVGGDLNFVEFGGGVFLAGGSFGNVFTSFDGSFWQDRSFGTAAWFDAAFGNGRWVIAGSGGRIAETSNGGQSWVSRSSGASSSIETVAYGPTAWVAAGTSNPGGQLLLASDCGLDVRADLRPFVPTGWSDRVVLSTTTGTTTDAAEITETDQIFVDAAWANLGVADAGPFVVEVSLVGGGAPTSINSTGLASGFFQSVSDLPLGPLPAGSYQIVLSVDSGDAVDEESEGNNVYTKPFVVTAQPCPGDATGDGVVDGGDLLEVINNFGASGAPGSTPGDVTGDGQVDGADLLDVINSFGSPC